MDLLQEQTLIHLINNALPNDFSFYHLGRVEQRSISYTFHDSCSVIFHFHGDLRAGVILVFESDLDFSIYAEIGNLLVSQIANQLSLENGLEVMVTPPCRLSKSQAKRIIESSPLIVRKTYTHFCQNSVIPIETLILPAPLEGTGYA